MHFNEYRPKRVTVIKRRDTARDGTDSDARLSGTMVIECIPETYLHVGTGKLKLFIAPQVFDRVRKEREFSRIVNYMRGKPYLVKYDYAELVRFAGKLCIPGSTVKGMCRSRIELLAISRDENVNFCFRFSSRTPPKEISKGEKGWRHFRIWASATWEDRISQCNPLKEGNVCRTCDLFGAPGLTSRVFFGDLYSEEDIVISMELDHEEKIEAIPPGSSFRGEISFMCLRPEELGLILIGLGAKRDGSFARVLLGRSKYRERIVVECPGKPELKNQKVRFGVVRFSLLNLRITEGYELLNLPPDRIEHLVRIYSSTTKLTDLVRNLVKNAIDKYPEIRPDFSEVDELERRNLYGGG
ncbi:MAG: hypothetical protein DRN53_01630 [Thermoprotei archaeon]|nr:MAG: hypothetical protein DRN53_01630 [Thermoprotei archaeon]